MSFRSVADYASAVNAGRYHVTTFRKAVASAATSANDLVDYTYFAGNPPANFYASAPLEAAYVERIRGILLPNTTKQQYVKSLTLMSAAAGATNTTNQRQTVQLLDYLMYYPFIDTDAVGELQEMVQTVSLPRYTSGQVMCVAQSAASAVGTFTMRYTNQDGVPNRLSAPTFTKVVAGGGILVSSTTNNLAGSQPYVELQSGDKGVRSIESVTFTAAGGGLLALVIVKPLMHTLVTQECRRTTAGSLDSFGAAYMRESVIHTPLAEIKNGAVLGLSGLGNAGTLASSILTGTLETVWST